MKYGCNRPSSFRGEVVGNCGRTDDGRQTTEPAYTISSPGAFGSGELIKSSTSYFIVFMPPSPGGEGYILVSVQILSGSHFLYPRM